MLYADASALVKLVVEERESEAMRAVLAGTDTCSSLVAYVEVALAAARALGEVGARAADNALRPVLLLAFDRVVADRAASLGALRALDAIHLASALLIRDDLEAAVTYDRRLAEAARAEGLTVLSPR